MKQFATFLLLLVIMIPLAETAHAKDEIITYEQLLARRTMHSICRGQDWRSLSDAYERNLDVKYTMAMAYKR